jgi:prefoldin subunit 5
MALDYEEIRKELAKLNREAHQLYAEVEEMEADLHMVQKAERTCRKSIKALRTILRDADEPYEIEKLKGVG